MRNKKKHKALEEKYEHYICEFCMEIGAKEVIKEFLEDMEIMAKQSDDCDLKLSYKFFKEKWEERLK